MLSKSESPNKPKEMSERSIVDSCFWFVGWIVSVRWLVLFLYKLAQPASYVEEAVMRHVQDGPGARLREEGLRAKHPVVFVPGVVTAGLDLSEGKQCAEALVRKRLWGGTFGQVYKRPLCWAEHMSLDYETGLDPPGIRVRSVEGLVAADYFAPGYFVWAVLIANLAQIGYEEKNMYMAAYDWRLSFQNTEVRDQTLTRLKSNFELMVTANGGNKAVVIPHSMGTLFFLHFMKWVEAPTPMGGGGGPSWCAKHIKTVVNIGGPFLGVPKALAGLFSAESRDIAVASEKVHFLDQNILGLSTLQLVMEITRTWDSVKSMLPRGGDIIWGNLEWSPEEDYVPSNKILRNSSGENEKQNTVSKAKRMNYGRMISFGKYVAEAPASEINRIDFRGASRGKNATNTMCGGVWTEYQDLGPEGIRAVADYKAYTAGEVIDLLSFVAPKMMARGSAHFSYGIADNLDDRKYQHYRYWSNPLETNGIVDNLDDQKYQHCRYRSNPLETKLPNAPDVEIFSLYGIGIPTERAYMYKHALPPECHIPFRIDTSLDCEDDDTCLSDGVYTVDGDGTVPVLSAGFMSAKGWRGKTRFNPSGIRTYVREYNHVPAASVLKGRGTQSGDHVDILGNFALIEDIMRIAAGATGDDLGGDRVYSDIFKWSEKINLRL